MASAFSMIMLGPILYASPLYDSWKWDVLDNLSHSLDLALADFYLFLHVKKYLTRKNFDDNDKVKDDAMMWFKGMAQTSMTGGTKLGSQA